MNNSSTQPSTHMTTERNYVGRARQKANSEYIVITLDLNEVLNQIPQERNGKPTLKVVMAKLRKPGQFGTTHTLYVPVEEDTTELENNRVADQQEIEYRRQE